MNPMFDYFSSKKENLETVNILPLATSLSLPNFIFLGHMIIDVVFGGCIVNCGLVFFVILLMIIYQIIFFRICLLCKHCALYVTLLSTSTIRFQLLFSPLLPIPWIVSMLCLQLLHILLNVILDKSKELCANLN